MSPGRSTTVPCGPGRRGSRRPRRNRCPEIRPCRAREVPCAARGCESSLCRSRPAATAASRVGRARAGRGRRLDPWRVGCGRDAVHRRDARRVRNVRSQRNAPEATGVLAQRTEFDEVVARHARVGRAAERVVVGEALHDVAPERLFEVQDVMRDSERRRAPARVVEVVDSATALRVRRPRRCVHLHRDAHDVVARLHKEAGGDGRVNSAAHRGNYARFLHRSPDRITVGRG